MHVLLPRMDYAARIKAGALVLLVLTALLTNVFYLRAGRAPGPGVGREDIVTASENRFAELKRVLPRRGVVGYVSDQTDESPRLERYFLAQHALAPLIVVTGADRALVVGDFATPAGAARAAAGSLVLVRDFGDGVVLLRRKPR